MAVKPVRHSARYPVYLSVRYATAVEYVREYAENLSKGGLFLPGAISLKPLARVSVEIELPGYRKFTVKAQVAHLLDAETAARFGRKPGAGLAIVDPPDDFSEALTSYLMRLGRRADHMVFAGHEGIRQTIAEAGYQVELILSAGAVVAALAQANLPVAGVVVDPQVFDAYQTACAAAGEPDIVSQMANANDLGTLLAQLDSKL